MSRPIRVLIVDDHRALAESMRDLLDDQPDLRVVGIAGDVDEAVAAVASGRPEVVLMDFRLRGCDGPEAARALLRRDPGLAVVFLSADDSEAARQSAAEAGAIAYLSKATAMGRLADAVRGAAPAEPG